MTYKDKKAYKENYTHTTIILEPYIYTSPIEIHTQATEAPRQDNKARAIKENYELVDPDLRC